MSAAIGLSHNMFDGALYLGVCDKIVPGLTMAALSFRPSAVGLYSVRSDGQRPAE
jgi:dihydroxyacid dehydratase/phosphogluconate dehydratase